MVAKPILAFGILALLAVPTLQARGLRALVDDYVYAVERRVAAQALASHGPTERLRFEALAAYEASLSGEIEPVVAAGDDLAEITAARLRAGLAAAGLELPVDAAPYDAARATRRRDAFEALGEPRAPELAPAPVPGDPDPDPDPTHFVRIKDQRPTYYITIEEEGFPTSGPLYGHSYTGQERQTIRTPGGQKITETSGRYFAALCMEGSGVLLDGRGLGFISNQRFELLPEGCLGQGSTGYWVVPFHTLAVNPREMPYKGVYYIPALRGLALPDGTTHDGFWFAHDTGSAFQGTPKHRIDMYVKDEDWIPWIEHHFVPSFTPIAVFRVDAATRAKVYAKYAPLLGP